MRIVKVELAECRVPLPREVRLGDVKVTTRDYVVVRLTDSSGAIGEAIGYVRSTALMATLEIVASRLVAAEFETGREFIDGFLRAHVNGRVTFHRAISLIDIALSDMDARIQQKPLHAVLGTRRTSMPTMAVAGYYMPERSYDDIEREVKSYFDQGVSIVKVMIDGHDQAFDRALVEKLSAIKSGHLAIDAHWTWETVDDAAAYLKTLDGLDLHFIEDPFGAHNVALTPDLQKRIETDLATGEDIAEAASLISLARDLRILRLDATTCGGIQAAVSVLDAVKDSAIKVLPHVFPHLHAQFGASYDLVDAIEFIAPEIGADPLDRLLKHSLDIRDGILHVSEAPGAGMALDWPAVETFQSRSMTVSAS